MVKLKSQILIKYRMRLLITHRHKSAIWNNLADHLNQHSDHINLTGHFYRQYDHIYCSIRYLQLLGLVPTDPGILQKVIITMVTMVMVLESSLIPIIKINVVLITGAPSSWWWWSKKIQVGSIFDAEGDKQQAYQYHFDRWNNSRTPLLIYFWLLVYYWLPIYYWPATNITFGLLSYSS